MSGYPLANRQNQNVSPPRAYGPTGPVGQVVDIPVSATAQYLDLGALTFGLIYGAGDGPPPYSSQGAGATPGSSSGAGGPGVKGYYITIYADGTDIGIILGATAASVSGGGAPVMNQTGSVGGTGIYAGATGTCYRIPAGQERRYKLQVGLDNYLGFIGAGTPGVTGTIRIYQSTPTNP